MHLGRKKSIIAAAIGLSFESLSFCIFLFLWPNLLEYLKSSYSQASFTIDLILGFSIRPLSSFFFGPYGDHFGRKRLLVLAKFFLSIVTFLFLIIPLTPFLPLFYISLGVTILRALQGSLFGADIAATTTYLSELCPKNKRGVVTSLAGISQEIGIALGLILTSLISRDDHLHNLSDFTWKVPVIISFVLLLAAFYMRKTMIEVPQFSKKRFSFSFVKLLFSKHKKQLSIAALLAIHVGVSAYLFRVFILFQSLNDSILMISEKETILLITTAATSFAIWLGGYVSDIIGRKPVLFTGALGVGLLSWPMFVLMTHPGVQSMVFIRMLVGQIVLSLFSGFYTGALYPFLAENFPTKIRNTGISISYNFAMSFSSMFIALFGLELGKKYTQGALPGILFSIWSILSLIVIGLGVKETYKRGIHAE
jgi:MFS family permease